MELMFNESAHLGQTIWPLWLVLYRDTARLTRTVLRICRDIAVLP